MSTSCTSSLAESGVVAMATCAHSRPWSHNERKTPRAASRRSGVSKPLDWRRCACASAVRSAADTASYSGGGMTRRTRNGVSGVFSMIAGAAVELACRRFMPSALVERGATSAFSRRADAVQWGEGSSFIRTRCPLRPRAERTSGNFMSWAADPKGAVGGSLLRADSGDHSSSDIRPVTVASSNLAAAVRASFDVAARNVKFAFDDRAVMTWARVGAPVLLLVTVADTGHFNAVRLAG